MSFGLSRSLCRLSPQIRNVGFQQQVRRNSTEEKVSDIFGASIDLGKIGGACVGSALGLYWGMDEVHREKSFGGKFGSSLAVLPAMAMFGSLGWVVGMCWPITVPVAAFCYLASEKEESSSPGLESREKLVEREKTLTRELSEIQSELSKKA